MIKKLIGIIAAVAVIVIVVVAAIRRDGFQSMVLRDELLNQTYPAGPAAGPNEPVTVDSLPGSTTPVRGVVIETDSTTVVITDSL